MKKILFAAMAALAITSCTQNEIDGIDNEKQDPRKEIKFGYTAVTRATAITTPTLGNFTVNAYANEAGTYSPTGAITIIDNGYFIRSANEWGSTNKYYWPTNKKVHFFGYNAKSDSATFVKEDAGYPTLQYEVATDVNKQYDLLVAKLENQTYNPTSNKISLGFKHALTQVVFSLKGDDANVTYTVQSIAIKGIYKNGTYNYETEAWGNQTTKETTGYTATPGTAITVNGTTEANFSTDNNTTFILMPQTIPADAKITVTYSAKITLNGTETEIHPASTPIDVDLTGTWAAGSKMAYTLILSGDKIKLEGNVSGTEWATPTSGGNIDVNK